jgi:hypothetical protein
MHDMLCMSAAALRFQERGEHPDFDQSLYALSNRLRQLACDTLACAQAPLYLGQEEESSTTDVLDMICKQYNKTGPEYCELMRGRHEWGGGPEIVALSNLLRRPVHVYELHTRGFFPRRFELRACARFGSPRFDSCGRDPLCILCADGRWGVTCLAWGWAQLVSCVLYTVFLYTVYILFYIFIVGSYSQLFICLFV